MGFVGWTEGQGGAYGFTPIVSGQKSQGARLGQARTEGYQVASLSQRALQAAGRLLIYHQLQESRLDRQS